MTDYYNKDFIEKIMQFDKMLDHDWHKTLDELSDDQTISEMKWYIHNLQYAVRCLYVVIENEMKQTNRIYKTISKLPNNEKYQELKSLFEERDNEIEKTIKPLSDYTKKLEESKKRRPEYIG